MSMLMLSYSEADSEAAESIAAIVREDGIDCIASPKTSDWARVGSREFDELLPDCLSYLPVLSPESERSQWLPYESGYAAGLEKHVVCYAASPSVQVPRYLSGYEILTSAEDLRRHLAECVHASMLRGAADSGS